VNSRHDLSVTSTDPQGTTYKATAENQVCIFCHTPHRANPVSPLWNQTVTGSTYTLYSSSTLTATMAQPLPTDNTRLCLSCHDGTVALGDTVNDGTITMANSVTTLPATAGTTYTPPRNTNLGTTLADDHPVAFTPTSPVLPAYPQVQPPPATDPVELENGMLECTSCHDPHVEANDLTERRFLVKPNSAAAICTTCHVLQGSAAGSNAWNWNSGPFSDHQSYTNTYDSTTNDPGDSDSSFLGAHTGYTTTATNACEACHRAHTAHVTQRLLKGGGSTEQGSAQVCYQCHDGNTTTNIRNPPTNSVVQNVKVAFSGKTYKHPGSTVAGSSGSTDAGHDPAETLPISSSRHATCDDCHNAHAAQGYELAGGTFPVPPALPSSLWGVGGVTASGSSRNRTSGADDAHYEYEICFKCHGDSTNKPQTTDYTITGIGYGRYPMRVGDFSGVTNCSTALPTRADALNEFSNNVVSFHPVVKLLNHLTAAEYPPYGVPSLRPYVLDINGNPITSRPLNDSSYIYCSDCHNSDTGRDTVSTRSNTTSPAGLHGSNNIHLLERTNALSTPSGTTGVCSTGNGGGGGGYNIANYELCNKCHDITNSILANKSFPQHSSHIQGSDEATACSTCHDPHASPGGGLVNFDKAVVGPSSSGLIVFVKKTATTRGSCTLRCHGENHTGSGDYTY